MLEPGSCGGKNGEEVTLTRIGGAPLCIESTLSTRHLCDVCAHARPPLFKMANILQAVEGELEIFSEKQTK